MGDLMLRRSVMRVFILFPYLTGSDIARHGLSIISSVMFVKVEWPLVKEPFVPQKRNDPPEVPDERFAFQHPFSNSSGHVMVAQTPVAEVQVIEKEVVQDGKQQDADGSGPEAGP
jgi:hypothetical protein